MTRSKFLFLAICVCCVSSASVAQVVPMTNEECTTAIPIFTGINPSAPAGLDGNVFTNVGSAAALSAGSPGMCGSGANSDVWFSYTALASGLHTFETCPPTGFTTPPPVHADTILQVLDGAACPPTVVLGCNDDAACGPTGFLSRLSVSLTATNTYFVRIASWSGEPDANFYLTVLAPLPPPANNDCANAINVADGSTSGTTAGATTTAGLPTLCASNSNDVWYRYTNSNTCDYTVTASMCVADGGSAGFDSVIAIFQDDCGTLVATGECNDDFCGLQSKLSFVVPAGASRLIMVSKFGTTAGGGGAFTMVLSHSSAAKAQLGAGCSDGGGAGPTMDLDLPPVLGSTRTLSITGAAPNAPGIVMFSAPGPFSALPGGCTLFLAQGSISILFIIGTDGSGNWSVTGMVPSSPSLECQHLWVQAFLLPPTLSPFYQVTSGLDLTLGL